MRSTCQSLPAATSSNWSLFSLLAAGLDVETAAAGGTAAAGSRSEPGASTLANSAVGEISSGNIRLLGSGEHIDLRQHPAYDSTEAR